ncbi:MAG: acetylxylan esterase [Planctomycetes bacterium]|nr:acetylxylan esterase [Planctomycetota bacterium]
MLAQPKGFNYDESKVPDFTLPDPLTLENRDQVTDADTWKNKRRPEIVDLFETHVYGRAPEDASGVRFGDAEVDDQALSGTAIRKQVKIYFSGTKDGPTADLLIYLPANAKAPAPIFVGLNFGGNHTVADDPEIWLPTSWMRDRGDGAVVDHRATEKGRGKSSSRWPVLEIVARGYAVATIYCGDIDPDFHDGFQNGVHPLFYDADQEKPAVDQWGTIAAWAWGLSRALDYFEADDDINHKQVAVLGHSRLGKTSLWAGARDERFALVISNGSGCGGAALSRRRFGETVKRINTKFPHWFCGNFHKYDDNEDALPVDQHMLAALVAPRPLYVASAERDLWADPRGEFLSLKFASPVYELLGRRTFSDVEMPAVDKPLLRDVAYHIRTGKHDITLYDWQRFMDFADRQFDHEE